jgi:hypothetical protein
MRSLDEKNTAQNWPRLGPYLPPTAGKRFGSAPLSTDFATGVAAWAVRRDGGNSQLFKPQFQPCCNAPRRPPDPTNGLFWGPLPRRIYAMALVPKMTDQDGNSAVTLA